LNRKQRWSSALAAAKFLKLRDEDGSSSNRFALSANVTSRSIVNKKVGKVGKFRSAQAHSDSRNRRAYPILSTESESTERGFSMRNPSPYFPGSGLKNLTIDP